LTRLGVAVLAGWLCGCARPPDVGSASTRTCSSCHVEEAQAWAASAHAWGRDDPVYAVAVAEAFDRSWCDGCHLHDGASVGCTSCHVEAGSSAVLAVTATAEGRAAHPVTERPHLGSEGCGTCHQIDVPSHQPGAPLGGPPLQDTLAEWRASYDDRSCADCHMAEHGHRMPGPHDATFREEALRVSVLSEGDDVVVTLHASGVGHAAPTGDPFHRVEVRFGADEDCTSDRPPLRFARLLVPDGRRMRVVHDVRVEPYGESRSLRIDWEELSDMSYWCARYVFADPRHEPSLAPGDYSVSLGSGRLKRGG